MALNLINEMDHLREFKHALEIPQTFLLSYVSGRSTKFFVHEATTYFRFDSEIYAWMKVNITGGWSLPQRILITLGGIPIYCMTFEDEDDLMAFHMKWL